MRLLLAGLLLTGLWAPTVRAQPEVHYSLAALVGDSPVRVETEWAMGRRGRTATVVATLGASSLSLHDGETVRTAIGSSGDHLCVVLIHGGDEHPSVRALLLHRDGPRLVLDATVPISRDLAIADRRPRFPADALVAATPSGFAVMVQHQERDTSADVVTTLTELGLDGAERVATHRVAVPWALAALVRDGDGYQLAVRWGGWGDAHAGTQRVCLVHLSADGTPTEHPWWASPFIAPSEVQLLRSAGATVVTWLDEGTGAVMGTRWTAPGGWSREPPAPDELGRVSGDASAWVVVERGGAVEVVSLP